MTRPTSFVVDWKDSREAGLRISTGMGTILDDLMTNSVLDAAVADVLARQELARDVMDLRQNDETNFDRR